MKQRNVHFQIGERYIGLVNGEVLTVTDIQMPGVYETKWGGFFTLAYPRIHFRSESTGKTHVCGLEHAKNLLLKKMADQTAKTALYSSGSSFTQEKRRYPVMKTPGRDFINTLRERYPTGSRITLNHMSDPYHPVEPGTKGTLDHIDDIGTFHVSWDNGRTLGLIYGEDGFSITPPVSIQKQDRYRYVAELSDADRTTLLDRLQTRLLESGVSDLETALANAQASRVVDLEDTIHIHYTAVSPDRRAVQPVSESKVQGTLSSRIQSAEEKKTHIPSSAPERTDPPAR